MAVVKMRFLYSLKRSVDYVTKDRGEEDIKSAINCNFESAADDMQATKVEHGKTDGRQMLELIQSFPPKERDAKTPDQFHELARKFVETTFPGFQAVLRTHTDKGHIHTHIRINTIHPTTGVRIANERQWGQLFGPPKDKAAMSHPENAAFAEAYKKSKARETYENRTVHMLRQASDKIVQEAGLSIVERQAHAQPVQMSQKVRDILHGGKASWVQDLMNKAAEARRVSTSYGEYQGTMLAAYGIEVRVEKKNVVYIYPGDKKRIMRGKKMGNLFDKDGLERNFANNDRMFANRPGLREEIHAGFAGLAMGSAASTDATHLKGASSKDYGAFASTVRKGRAHPPQSEKELDTGIIPLSEIRKANSSILDYCNRNNIQLLTNKDGKTVLKGREHVVIEGHWFKNTKSGSGGMLIDFMTIHKDCTMLQAFAQLSNNPKVLLLEQYFGDKKRDYRAFYFPKQGRLEPKAEQATLSRFFRSFGGSEKTAHALHQSGQAQVSLSGLVRLFAQDDASGALEFSANSDGTWRAKRNGSPQRALFTGKPQGKSLHVFVNAKDFLARHGERTFAQNNGPKGVLALLTHDYAPLDIFLATHKETSQLVFHTPGRPMSKTELDFFGVLKKRYEPFGMKLEHTERELDLSRSRPGLSR